MTTKSVAIDPHIALRSALGIGLAYLVVGSAWILFSDALVESVSRHPDWLLTAQRYKGLVYIALTTAGLVYLVHRGHCRLLALEDKAARSDLQAKDLFERHPQPMWVYDQESLRFLRVNDAALSAYGYSRDEFLAMTLADIRSAADRAPFEAVASVFRHGGSSTRVFRHVRKDGTPLLARISKHRVDLQGRQAVMVMAEDVTQEVALQDAVGRQQRQFRQLHDSLGEVLWIASPDFSSIVHVSAAFESLYGRKASDLLNDPGVWLEAVHPDDRDKVIDLRTLPVDHDGASCEYRIVRPDGTVRWIEDRKRRIRDSSGAVVLVGGIAEDITARKERDEAREDLNHRLEALVAKRTEALQQANIELEAFSRTAAHDLKSPLNGIVGMSGLLRAKVAGKLDDDARRYLELIERSSRDMAGLIDDLLALSQAGTIELRCKRVDLAPVVRAQIDQLRILDPLRQVEVDMPEHLPMYCDQGLMHSVLQNLISNAWKFTTGRAVAQISIHVTEDGEMSTMQVSDNGAGFDASGIGQLLRPFQRFHPQAHFRGHGLGLVTCQRIAMRHGGWLSIQSEVGAGTSVSVSLPDRGSFPGS